MNSIIFECTGRSYSKQNFLNNHLDSFAHFLTDDTGGGGTEYYKNWLTFPSTDTGGNETWLRKHGMMIEISFLDYHSCFMTQENFVQLLDDWEKLHNNMVPRVLLYEENGKILLAPCEEEQA